MNTHTRIMSLIIVLFMLISSNGINVCAYDTSTDGRVTSADYTAEELSCDGYDLGKYTAPLWEGNITYNECVFPIKSSDRTLQPFTLMYDATEIISVKNSTFNVTYTEGVDYELVDGGLVILPSGNISVVNYSYIHPTENPNGNEWTVYYPTANGSGYEYWNEGTEFINKQLAVVYIHNDVWDGYIPEAQSSSLPNTTENLQNKEQLKVTFVGGSVTSGSISSGIIGLSPYCDAYPQMTMKALKQEYGYEDIQYSNCTVDREFTLT